MRGHTHAIFGMALISVIYIVYPQFAQYENYFMALAWAMLGAVAPDLDHPHSLISKEMPRGSKVIQKVAKHRGWTHTIWGLILFSVGFGALMYYIKYATYIYAAVAFAIGYFSHLLSDSLNPTGVGWINPKRKRGVRLIRTGSKQEDTFMWIVAIIFAAEFFIIISGGGV